MANFNVQFPQLNYPQPISPLGGLAKGIERGVKLGAGLQEQRFEQTRQNQLLGLARQQEDRLNSQAQKQEERAKITQGFAVAKAMSDIGLDDELVGQHLNDNVLPLLGGGLGDVNINNNAKKVTKILDKIWTGVEDGTYSAEQGLMLMGQATAKYPKRGQQIKQSMQALELFIRSTKGAAQEKRAVAVASRAKRGFEEPAVKREAEHKDALELKKLDITSREKIAADKADAAAKKYNREEARGDSRKIRLDIEKMTEKYRKELIEEDKDIKPLELRLQVLIFRDRMMERVFLDPDINIPPQDQGGTESNIGDESTEDLLRMLAK